jgi:hypothetical protein
MPDFVGTNAPAFAYLQAWVATFMQHYAPGISDRLRRHGKTTRIMPGTQRVMNGSNVEYEVQAYHNRSTRIETDLMAPQADPRPGAQIRFNVNLDHTDATNNHIVVLEITFRTTYWDIKKRMDTLFKAEQKDFVRRDMEQGVDDVKESFSRYLHLPKDGLLATIATGGIKDADDQIFADASAYSGGDTAYLKLDPVSIALIGDGQFIEIRDAADNSLHANNVRVDYVQPFENAVMVKLTPESVDGAGDPVTDFAAIAPTDKLYLHGNFNKSPHGTLERYFDQGEGYYSVANRLDGINNMLMPIVINVAGSATAAKVDLTEDHYTRVGEVVGWMGGDGNVVNRRTMVMSRNEYRATTKFVKDAGIVLTPGLESQIGQRFNRAFGHDGFVLHDPNLGAVMVVVDDFAPFGKIRFLNLDNWEMVVPYGGAGGFDMMPGPIAGVWSRHTEEDGTGRPSKTFSAQGIQAFAFVSRWPKGDASLEGLKIVV